MEYNHTPKPNRKMLLSALSAAMLSLPICYAQEEDSGLETPPPSITLTQDGETVDLNPTPTPTPTPATPLLPPALGPALGIPLPTPTTEVKTEVEVEITEEESSEIPAPAPTRLLPPPGLNNPGQSINGDKIKEEIERRRKEREERVRSIQERQRAGIPSTPTPAPETSPTTAGTDLPAPPPRLSPTGTPAKTDMAEATPTPTATPAPQVAASTPTPAPEEQPLPPLTSTPELGNPLTPEEKQEIDPIPAIRPAPPALVTATPTPSPMVPVVPTATPTPEPIVAPIVQAPTPTPQPPRVIPQAPALAQPEPTTERETSITGGTDPGLTNDLATQVGGTILPSITDKTPEDVEDILRELEEKTRNQESRSTVAQPNRPQDEHTYENVNLLRVLRILAEQAGINFIEPNMTEEAAGVISFRLQKMTPLEAFLRVAESRGFRVVTRNDYTTLTRPDIETPRFMVTRKYPLRHSDPMWVLQSVANLLGIEISSPAESLATFPAPQDTGSGGGGGGGGGGSGVTGLNLGNVGIPDNPRWTASLPFDAPLSGGTGAQSDEPSVFIDRKSNAIVVKSTEEDQIMVARYIQEIDHPEPQIMIEAKIVEMSLDDELLQGIDWSAPMEQGLTFGLFPTGGETGDPINIATFTQDVARFLFTPTTLFMNSNTAEITIRNFQRLRMGSVVAEPRVMTKTGVPVTIRSTIIENIPVLTPQANTGAVDNINSTEFESFTTGLAMDVVPRLLDNGEVEININPTVASEIGRTPATDQIPSGVPIISERVLTTTATVRSGMTIVIGGLNVLDNKSNDGGVPPLNRVPWLGNRVFGNQNKDKAKRTLLVFVTPKIIYPNQYEKVYTSRAEYQMMLEAGRQTMHFQPEKKPEAIEIRKAEPIQRRLRTP